MKMDYQQICKNEEISLLIEKGNEILQELGYGKRKIELAKIAGYMHDIGNSINRHDHAQSGAILA